MGGAIHTSGRFLHIFCREILLHFARILPCPITIINESLCYSNYVWFGLNFRFKVSGFYPSKCNNAQFLMMRKSQPKRKKDSEISEGMSWCSFFRDQSWKVILSDLPQHLTVENGSNIIGSCKVVWFLAGE